MNNNLRLNFTPVTRYRSTMMFHVWVTCMTKFTRHKRHTARTQNFRCIASSKKTKEMQQNCKKKMQTPSLVELHSTNTVSFNKHRIIPQTADCTCRHLKKGGCWVGAQNLQSMRSYCKTSHIEAAANPAPFLRGECIAGQSQALGFILCLV